jgi:hypothetical protein
MVQFVKKYFAKRLSFTWGRAEVPLVMESEGEIAFF